MLRDKSLIPLSRQHQHALALCVRIDRAEPVPDVDLETWQAEIEQIVEREIKIHFAAEEDVLFPVARRFPELVPVVEALMIDHASLRESFIQVQERGMTAASLAALAQQLSAHIRKEERHLFERMQQLMTSGELAELGTKVEGALKDAGGSCVLMHEATKLGPKP